jgi:hypothetical protein
MVFLIIGIPYFAYMMSTISENINTYMNTLRKNLETANNITIPKYGIMIVWSLGGALFLILLPAFIFRAMEEWNFLGKAFYLVCSKVTITECLRLSDHSI